jgi:hypothetical protein
LSAVDVGVRSGAGAVDVGVEVATSGVVEVAVGVVDVGVRSGAGTVEVGVEVALFATVTEMLAVEVAPVLSVTSAATV